ncbi:hypothetical protein IVB27_09040 [Bradyrhizobium sp. 197]|uniref:hypothetical protein n=1 Tax=Bradyrhizobium sp. 197 TaxID=2782663 RepID=UPI001FF774B1|nr:hypothetical protein [Bradyrhizobium sp. 197]MCK1474944.1 hypothetical protein [Bradyrhizobium sp. 197]
MVWWGRRSDWAAERRYHAALPLLVASAALVSAALVDDPSLKMLAFCIAGFGIFACLPVFWTLPTAFFVGRRGRRWHRGDQFNRQSPGIRRPFAMGWLRDHTGSYRDGPLLLAGLGIIAMGLALGIGHNDALERSASASE